jgi:hypothetical protein
MKLADAAKANAATIPLGSGLMAEVRQMSHPERKCAQGPESGIKFAWAIFSVSDGAVLTEG